MLIALSIYLFTIFGGVSGVHERIEDNVQDSIRREAALEVLGGIKDLQAVVEEQMKGTAAEFCVVHRDYGATREDYLAVTGPLQQTRIEVGSRLRESWLEMREILTDEEWTMIFPRAEE